MKTAYKEKIRKKKKSKQYKKRKPERSPSNSESSIGDEWVEAPPPSSFTTIKDSSDSEISSEDSCTNQRDAWMNEESFVPTLSKEEMFRSSSRQTRLDTLKEQKKKEEEVKNERELNPHWKNQGKGLPEKEVNVESLSLPSTSVGDGGYSWLKKAYYRIKEQSQQEGKSMEEIAAERWGSLNKLESMIKEAEERMNKHPDREQRYSRSKYKYEYKRDQDRRSEEKRFKEPGDNDECGRKQPFDRPYEFRKPSSDKKHKINQFKSSRSSKYSDYKKLEEENKDDRVNEASKVTEKQEKRKDKEIYPDNEKRLPAWKKPKFSETKAANKEKEATTDFTHKSNQRLPTENIKRYVSKVGDISILFSCNDLNELAAEKLRAEMAGDTALAQKFQKQLDAARERIEEESFGMTEMEVQKPKHEEVILTKLDSQGQARPIRVCAERKRRKSNKYVDEKMKYSLKQMFEREKLTTADDQMEMFVEASSKYDDESEIDMELGNVPKKLTQKMSTSREEEKDIGKAINQHQRQSAALERCQYCLDKIEQHLLVEIGEVAYLCLPSYQCLTEGHCLIVPRKHVSSFLFLDENELKEVKDFKRNLRNLFKREKKRVIFMETSLNFRFYPHAILECIPVSEEDGDMAPLYFKKAIQESEYEWAHNKKLVDLTKKDLQHSIPKNLPYFHVEFDPEIHAGYAHVIEEEKRFPRNFGKEILGGMMDINYHLLFKNKKEDPLRKLKEVVAFEKKWKSLKN